MSSYGRLCSEFYDLDKPSPPAKALAFYRSLAGQADGPVIEPMCGSGRFLVSLAEAGVEIDGADSSPHMLAACRRRLTQLGLACSLYARPIEAMDLPRRYGLAIIPAASFSLIADEERARRALLGVHDALLPGGAFAVEIETARSLPEQPGVWSGRWVNRPDGSRILLSSVAAYDEDARVVRSVNRYEAFQASSLLDVEYEELTERLYEPAEFADLLRDCGFSNIEARKAYEEREPEAADALAVFLCRRS